MEIKDERVLSAKAKLNEATEQFDKAVSAKCKAMDEYAAALQKVMEEKAVNNEGKIKTRKGEEFFFDRVKMSYGSVAVWVNPIKKDGGRALTHRIMFVSDFLENI